MVIQIPFATKSFLGTSAFVNCYSFQAYTLFALFAFLDLFSIFALLPFSLAFYFSKPRGLSVKPSALEVPQVLKSGI